jgi:hypothetical protein
MMPEWLAVVCMCLTWAMGFWTAWNIKSWRDENRRTRRAMKWAEWRMEQTSTQEPTSADLAPVRKDGDE